jgi:hypothetical protein
MLARIHNPKIDPRKPYTEIGTDDCFSGRTYDERYITEWISRHDLPCNPTTAFLTPGLRNIDHPLTTATEIIGRPKQLYSEAIQILENVAEGKEKAENVFEEIVRLLIIARDQKGERLNSLLESLKQRVGELPLSSEQIVALLEQHLACKNSSRLPVLITAAAYMVASEYILEEPLPLYSHNAADLQTGSLGDVEIKLKNDESVVTVYEMKDKPVVQNDVDVAVQKIVRPGTEIDNYIFITTAPIDSKVVEYAQEFYEQLGVEISVLDCIGFIRHFLHFFHRLRSDFLDRYQELVLDEPESAVNQALKEAFFALRHAAECIE